MYLPFTGFFPVQIHSKLIESEAQMHWAVRVMIRTCLLLSLWNLPLPWLHLHELHPEEEVSSHWLSTHLDEYHADLESQERGWHLHFIYLGGERSNDPLQKRLPSQHYFIMGESTGSLPTGSSVASTLDRSFLLSAQGTEFTTFTLNLSPNHPGYISGPSISPPFSSKSLRDLISVSRC